jgi:hypothetical protein
MLQRIAGLPPGIDGVHAVGEVSTCDVSTVLEPLLADANQSDSRLRFVYELGPGMNESAAAAAWEIIRLAIQLLPIFDGCAIISDLPWVHEATELVSPALPCPLRVFATRDRPEALAWLASLPGRATAHAVPAE